MKKEEFPTKGLYCPAKEAHSGRRNRVLAAFSDDAIYLHCHEHDWLKIKLLKFGKKIDYKDVTAIIKQVVVPDGEKIVFDLKPIAAHTKGVFKIKHRGYREANTDIKGKKKT